MSCVLRLQRDTDLITEVTALGLQGCLARGDKTGSSVNVTVSNADFADCQSQVDDAIAFLRQNKEKLLLLNAVTATLDFGVELRDVAVQTEMFPAELLRLAGGLSIGIEVSIYPRMSNTTE